MHQSISTLPVILSFLKFCVARTSWVERHQEKQTTNYRSFQIENFGNLKMTDRERKETKLYLFMIFLACRKFESQNYRNLMNKSFLFKIWTTFPQPVLKLFGANHNHKHCKSLHQIQRQHYRLNFIFLKILVCKQCVFSFRHLISATVNYPKKPGFNLYQLRHCAYITTAWKHGF